MTPDTVEVYRDTAGEWRWRRINGQNGKITATSGEGYVHLEHAVEMAEKINQGITASVEGR